MQSRSALPGAVNAGSVCGEGKENGARMGAKGSPFGDAHEVAQCLRYTRHAGLTMLPGHPAGLSNLGQKVIRKGLQANL